MMTCRIKKHHNLFVLYFQDPICALMQNVAMFLQEAEWFLAQASSSRPFHMFLIWLHSPTVQHFAIYYHQNSIAQNSIHIYCHPLFHPRQLQYRSGSFSCRSEMRNKKNPELPSMICPY